MIESVFEFTHNKNATNIFNSEFNEKYKVRADDNIKLDHILQITVDDIESSLDIIKHITDFVRLKNFKKYLSTLSDANLYNRYIQYTFHKVAMS